MEVHALVRSNADTSLLPSDDRLHLHAIDYRKELSETFLSIRQTAGNLDYFIHNAGMTVSLKNEEYYDVNVGLTKRVAEALKTAGWLLPEGIFVYTSSYAANGPATLNEPVSHYGRSKKAAEAVIEEHFPNHLLARPTAIYGAGDVAFLPLFKSAKMGIYPVTNDQQRMSMIHARDLARMMVHDMQTHTGVLHYNDGTTYLHKDFIAVFQELLSKKIRSFPLPKWLVKFSMGASDVWHKLINKRPGITLEKFDEISQHWDLHTTDLKHSDIPAEISLKEGFEDALNFYIEKKLI